MGRDGDVEPPHPAAIPAETQRTRAAEGRQAAAAVEAQKCRASRKIGNRNTRERLGAVQEIG